MVSGVGLPSTDDPQIENRSVCKHSTKSHTIKLLTLCLPLSWGKVLASEMAAIEITYCSPTYTTIIEYTMYFITLLNSQCGS